LYYCIIYVKQSKLNKFHMHYATTIFSFFFSVKFLYVLFLFVNVRTGLPKKCWESRGCHQYL